MKADFSKFKSPQLIAKEHNLNVFQQQGRVSLDQDWNEQSEINRYRSETALCDIIGKSGAPFDNAGFKIEEVLTTSPPASPIEGDLKISAGHYYVDGILCENEEDVPFEDQRDFPGQKLPEDPGNYLFYLDVWLRHITVLEDKYLREVALGGPDTTTRTKVVWQVKCAKITDTSPISPPDCSGTDFPEETKPSTGTLSARSNPSTNSTNPCDVAATGGYSRLQNQLYRVEIHKGSDEAGGPTYKWSRDNGSVVVSWQDYDTTNPEELKVSSLGKDELLGFNAGDWIEIIDDTTDLLNKPGILARIAKPPQNNTITIETASIIYPAGVTSISLGKGHPRIRKWDSQGDLPINLNTWVDLEDGVQANIRINEAESTLILKSGDNWMIPARSAIPDVEWTKDLFLPPFGIRHHYTKLAIANFDGTKGWSIISDCRNLFPALTELTSLYYVGGDGQEAMPGNVLPEPLMVGVANGSWAVGGAKVKFEILSGGGSLNAPPDGIVTTDSNGIAKCMWTIGTITSSLIMQVKASLLDGAGNIFLRNLPVIFNAGFNIASNVAYDGGDCKNWGSPQPGTVADALTALCKGQTSKSSCSLSIGRGGDYPNLVEALLSLEKLVIDDKLKDICLCFLPGDHIIGKDILLETEKIRTIKITGCNALIIMKAANLKLSASKIILQGFTLRTEIKNASIKLSADEVNADHCTFIQDADNEDIPLIVITPRIENKSNATINWNRNHITSERNLVLMGLALSNRVSGWIENNTIDGALILQYIIEKRPIWKDSAPARLDILNKIKSNLKNHSWHLNIRGNVLNNVITNARGIIETADNLSYKSLIISENVFPKINKASPVGPVNSSVAVCINMVNNHFIENGVDNIVQLVGIKSVVMGNIGFENTTKIQTSMGAQIGIPPPGLNALDVVVI